MPRLLPIDLFIGNLEDTFPEGAIGYMTKEEALANLIRLTNENFGFDVEKWKEFRKTSWKDVPKDEKVKLEEIPRIMREVRRRNKKA